MTHVKQICRIVSCRVMPMCVTLYALRTTLPWGHRIIPWWCWCAGSLVLWCPGALVPWCPGALAVAVAVALALAVAVAVAMAVAVAVAVAWLGWAVLRCDMPC